jgi:hypothetical protein
MADGKCRKVLQFNSLDFRHAKVLEIFNQRPRNMTELVVNAVLHYISCPDASLELTKESIRKIVAEVLMEMQADGTLSLKAPGDDKQTAGGLSHSEQEELSGFMGAFRGMGSV